MKKYLLWAFIWFVAAVDLCFAWTWRDIFPYWETNPVALVLFYFGGIWAVLFFRVALLAAVTAIYFIAYRLRAREWLLQGCLGVWLLSHALLLVYYFCSFWHGDWQRPG